jgi:hypothetical protein
MNRESKKFWNDLRFLGRLILLSATSWASGASFVRNRWIFGSAMLAYALVNALILKWNRDNVIRIAKIEAYKEIYEPPKQLEAPNA